VLEACLMEGGAVEAHSFPISLGSMSGGLMRGVMVSGIHGKIIVHAAWNLSRSHCEICPVCETENMRLSKAFSSTFRGPFDCPSPPCKTAYDIRELMQGMADGLVRVSSKRRTSGDINIVIMKGVAEE
jgi:hypothetical protein